MFEMDRRGALLLAVNVIFCACAANWNVAGVESHVLEEEKEGELKVLEELVETPQAEGIAFPCWADGSFQRSSAPRMNYTFTNPNKPNGPAAIVSKKILMRSIPLTPVRSLEFTRFLCKLHSGAPTTILLFGGSPTVASEVDTSRNYGWRIQKWLNIVYPPKSGSHRVINKAVAATDTCFLAAAYRQLKPKQHADLVVLEYGINDLMESGGSGMSHHELEGESYERILDCTESVVRLLLKGGSAVVFFELGMLSGAWSAQEVHAKVAKGYNIPVLSWRDTTLCASRLCFMDHENLPEGQSKAEVGPLI